MNDTEFQAFPKIARYSREVIVTEKIDGTNAQVMVVETDTIGFPCEGAGAVFEHDGLALFAGSRKRWITPEADNFGFAKWVRDHAWELLTLGPGRHFGEWWGSGIQRGYGLEKGEKRFSLFNVARWCLHGETPRQIPCGDPRTVNRQDALPACVGLVPVLWRGLFDDLDTDHILADLAESGSRAAPGFMHPEGVVVFHSAGCVGFKKTLEGDGEPKRQAAGVSEETEQNGGGSMKIQNHMALLGMKVVDKVTGFKGVQ